MSNQNLTLAFHGRIIDHLGIQMYQSPTAAIAEIVSNAWDADAENVRIAFDFNSSQKSDWKITVSDDGRGMSFGDCQERFLSVGYNRRANNPSEKSPGLLRPVMGRKGIGKFAGFGIAHQVVQATPSGLHVLEVFGVQNRADLLAQSLVYRRHAAIYLGHRGLGGTGVAGQIQGSEQVGHKIAQRA